MKRIRTLCTFIAVGAVSFFSLAAAQRPEQTTGRGSQPVALSYGGAGGASAYEGSLILNEFNAVGPTKYLEDGEEDTTFGIVQGNGGDWIELVVIEDGLTIKGWQIDWANDDPTPRSGTLTFSQHNDWGDLPAGTIVTIRSADDEPASDLYVTGCNSGGASSQDWWARANANQSAYIIQSGNDPFQVDNDGWRMRILDSTGAVVQDWVGEGEYWQGSGVNSEEVGKLEEDPSSTPGNYNDGNCSSFGWENCWNNRTSFQDFSDLRCP